MMVYVGVMKRNYSKEDFVWILGNLFLATGWLTIHYLQSVSIAAPLTHLRSMFQFNRIWNPVIIIPAKARDYGITGVGLSVCLFVTTITK